MLNQILVFRFTLKVPCKILLWLSHYQAKFNGVLPSTKHCRWMLHYYNFLTCSNDHRKNSNYKYIIFICFIYSYIIFIFFSENNDIINMHTILLTKYEMRIQRQNNIYIWIPPKLTQIWHFIIIMHDIALLYWCRWYYIPRVNDQWYQNPRKIILIYLSILIQPSISNYDHS